MTLTGCPPAVGRLPARRPAGRPAARLTACHLPHLFARVPAVRPPCMSTYYVGSLGFSSVPSVFAFPCATVPPTAQRDTINLFEQKLVDGNGRWPSMNVIGSLIGKPARLTIGYTISLSMHYN
jgi:hypothetical protein